MRYVHVLSYNPRCTCARGLQYLSCACVSACHARANLRTGTRRRAVAHFSQLHKGGFSKTASLESQKFYKLIGTKPAQVHHIAMFRIPLCSMSAHACTRLQYVHVHMCTDPTTYKTRQDTRLYNWASGSKPTQSFCWSRYLYLYIYILIGDTAFWSPRAPVLRANVKPARSHPVTWKDLLLSFVSWCVTSKSWLVCCDSQFELPLSLTSSMLGAQLPFAALLRAAKASQLGAHAVGLLVVCLGLETATSLQTSYVVVTRGKGWGPRQGLVHWQCRLKTATSLYTHEVGVLIYE